MKEQDTLQEQEDMVYCMSDIHGEIDRYLAMLDLIQFSDDDVLYCLGDVIDRYPRGIEILQDMMSRPNVHMLLGNHEHLMLQTFWSDNDYDARRLWKRNGGNSTYNQMVYGIPTGERLKVLRYIQELPDKFDIEVNGQSFHLVHGFPADITFDRIWGRPDPPPTEPPIPGKTVIVGHTPTYDLNVLLEAYDEGAPYEIWYGPGIIDIDCGCGRTTGRRRLACLRLNDMQEFYV